MSAVCLSGSESTDPPNNDMLGSDKGQLPTEDSALPSISIADLMRLEDEEDKKGNISKTDDLEEEEEEEEEDDEEEEEEEKQEGKKEEPEKEAALEEVEKQNNEDDENEDTGRLFVRNLPFSATEDDLYKLFKKYGEITEVNCALL